MVKVLFVYKDYFSYGSAIKVQLEKDGLEVTDCPYQKEKLNYFQRKKYAKLGTDFSKMHFEQYIDNIVRTCIAAEEIDVVLVAFIEIDKDSLNKLKSTFTKAKFIKCVFDDVEWYGEKRIQEIVEEYDEVISYYEKDAKKYGMKYNPNFYAEEIVSDKKYDWSFIGTAPEDRERVLKNLLASADKKKFFLYILKGQLGLRDRIKVKLKNTSLSKYIYFSPVKYEDMLDIFSKSRCIVDIQHPWQRGLSLRPFHALSMKTKLITTNSEIKEYDFYNPENIWIMDINDPKLPEDSFFEEPYIEISASVYEKYSLKSWCNRLESYMS